MGKKHSPGALAGATGAGGNQVRGYELSDTTDGGVAPASTKPLAVIGRYKLIEWEPRAGGTGQVGIATVVLPSGKLGGYAIHNVLLPFAEWWPTSWLPRKLQSNNLRELNAACPYAVELVRQFDSEVLSKPFSLLPVTKRKDTGQ